VKAPSPPNDNAEEQKQAIAAADRMSNMVEVVVVFWYQSGL
jgi:hypothetical protein